MTEWRFFSSSFCCHCEVEFLYCMGYILPTDKWKLPLPKRVCRFVVKDSPCVWQIQLHSPLSWWGIEPKFFTSWVSGPTPKLLQNHLKSSTSAFCYSVEEKSAVFHKRLQITFPQGRLLIQDLKIEKELKFQVELGFPMYFLYPRNSWLAGSWQDLVV